MDVSSKIRKTSNGKRWKGHWDQLELERRRKNVIQWVDTDRRAILKNILALFELIQRAYVGMRGWRISTITESWDVTNKGWRTKSNSIVSVTDDQHQINWQINHLSNFELDKLLFQCLQCDGLLLFSVYIIVTGFLRVLEIRGILKWRYQGLKSAWIFNKVLETAWN